MPAAGGGHGAVRGRVGPQVPKVAFARCCKRSSEGGKLRKNLALGPGERAASALMPERSLHGLLCFTEPPAKPHSSAWRPLGPRIWLLQIRAPLRSWAVRAKGAKGWHSPAAIRSRRLAGSMHTHVHCLLCQEMGAGLWPGQLAWSLPPQPPRPLSAPSPCSPLQPILPLILPLQQKGARGVRLG